MVMAIDDYIVLRDVPPVRRLTFPNLESYCEEIVSPDEAIWPWFWQAIRKSTKLAVVSSFLLHNAIPYSQLTTWEYQFFDRWDDVENFLYVAQSCTVLESLTLSDVSSDNSDYPVAVREVKLQVALPSSIIDHN
ncbi:hypothetical protein E1B28_006995 [Marasmius oreades]|uniref:Uncharacterized protein n=1 Tax=Marasmius oreades TaxID=181124 RepID=A0A9P7S0X2_9AGAR|nr:uncharacterized protein E1B28_006995 [Marasmius oreades]KAG7093312.1 hypothetical protein E1B28_006995 [Marasmius oreades]